MINYTERFLVAHPSIGNLVEGIAMDLQPEQENVPAYFRHEQQASERLVVPVPVKEDKPVLDMRE
ncbi:hypothetical protein KY343_04160 [Candidatus Woesearchaeota archaeon]|nr:hypothetical protein [Candidatus Woesearchaeota archaeon]